jgi:hypothetical protein
MCSTDSGIIVRRVRHHYLFHFLLPLISLLFRFGQLPPSTSRPRCHVPSSSCCFSSSFVLEPSLHQGLCCYDPQRPDWHSRRLHCQTRSFLLLKLVGLQLPSPQLYKPKKISIKTIQSKRKWNGTLAWCSFL